MFAPPTSSAQTPAAPSLFGTPAAAPAAAPSLFGTPAAAPAAAPLLFGTTATSGAPAAPPLFGVQAASTSAAPSLFSTPAAGTAAPSLFGAPAANTAQGAPSYFGAKPSQQSSLFAPSTAGTSLFGTSPAAPGTGLSMFGAPAAAATFTPSQTQQQQQLQAGQPDFSTKYADLDANWQRVLNSICDVVQEQKRLCQQLDPSPVGEIAMAVKEDTQRLAVQIQSIQALLERDKRAILQLRETTSREAGSQIALISNAIAELGKREISQASRAEFTKYFADIADKLETRSSACAEAMDAIENKLRNIVLNERPSPETLTAIVRHQHELFMAIAGKVAERHENVKKLKEAYLRYRRLLGDHRNPFEVRERSPLATSVMQW